MSTDNLVLVYPFSTAQVVVIVDGTMDRPIMVLRHMFEAAEITAEAADGHKAESRNAQVSTVFVHDPFHCKLDFAGVEIEIVVTFSSTKYVERRQLGRYVYPLFPSMLKSAGLDIDNIRAIPTHELTPSERQAAFLAQFDEPLAVGPNK